MLAGTALAQQLSSIEYDPHRYATEYGSSSTQTVRTYRNGSDSDRVYEIDLNYDQCVRWSFGLTLLRRAGLARSTSSCSTRHYDYRTTLQPGETARTTRTERTKIDYYRIYKIAVYSDGSSQILDTYRGTRVTDLVSYATRVY
jgi:hypothetical protein